MSLPVAAPEPRIGGATLWVAVEGGAIAVETVGHGPALVCLHGWTLDRRMWAMQAQALADRFTLIAVDRRGFGQSTAPANIALETDDVGLVAAALGLTRFALLGMSQAGSVAVHYAQSRPDRVTTLLLQGISLAGVADDGPEADRIPLAAFTALIEAGHLEAMKAAWSDHVLMAGLSGDAAAIGAAMLADYDGRDLLSRTASPLAHVDTLATLTMPILAITGAADTRWRRDIVRAIGQTAPKAVTASIPNGGHLCNLSHPEAYNAAIADFLCGTINRLPGSPDLSASPSGASHAVA